MQQLLRVCGQIQEQLQAMQQAAEQSRQEAKQEATQNVAAIVTGLQAFQETSSAERVRELEALQSSNKTMLVLAGTVAGIGILAMLVLTYFQSRTSNCLARLCAALPTDYGPGPSPRRLTRGSPAEQSNRRLLGALEQLDQRIHEFKRAIGSDGNGDSVTGPARVLGDPESSPVSENGQISLLLDKANSLMSSGNVEAALALCDEALVLDPDHPEALVKKGAALERLQKLNEAIECYDRAIAVDSSMTTAYLYKGGLYNRLERFKEALQCYEKALHTHDQRGS
jgi:tetratricopeptide (TPR) repeat protein